MKIGIADHLNGIPWYKMFNHSYCKMGNNLGIVMSIWLFHVNVLSIIIPKKNEVGSNEY